MANLTYLVLNRFRELFEGVRYRHRDSSLGDSVAQLVPEDLFNLGRSRTLVERVKVGSRVINVQNMRRGIDARRGDGSFGEIVPGTHPAFDPGFNIAKGQVATIEIGSESKILAKAMIKQIDRVINDLNKQLDHFRLGDDNPLTIALVGINWAENYTSYEKDRMWPTDGKAYKHPSQEAKEAEARIRKRVTGFTEMIFLRFAATNKPPYPFRWVDQRATELDYAAALTRLSRSYEDRF